MSDEDHIKHWRARRNARVEQANQVEAGEALAVMTSERPASPQPVTALLAMVLVSLASVQRWTVADRRGVYDAVEREQVNEATLAGASEETMDLQRRRSRMVARAIEIDIRAGVDVFATGYMPAALLADDAHLMEGVRRRDERRKLDEVREARRRASRDDVAFEFDLRPEDAAEVAILRERVEHIHARQRTPKPGTLQSRLLALPPLLRIQLQIIQGESPIALLWALIGPVMLLSLISSFYILSGAQYILGMDVPTFSMLGATAWIMFRQVIFRSSTAYVSMRGLINLESVTPLSVALVQGFIFLCIYVCVFGILISMGHSLGVVSLPASVPHFLMYVLLMGGGGVSVGVIFGSIATGWHFFLRFSTVIERSLQMFSSVFLVSEQLPEQYRKYFLWSPFAHGMQLLRSAYFDSYKSQDASVAYFATSLVFLAVVAFATERTARRHVQPM